MLGLDRRPRQYQPPTRSVTSMMDLLKGSGGILCPQLVQWTSELEAGQGAERASNANLVMRYWGLLDIDADFSQVMRGCEPLRRGGEHCAFGTAKELKNALRRHMETIRNENAHISLGDCLQEFPAVLRACRAAVAIADALCKGGVDSVAYFSGEKGARVLFKSDRCFSAVNSQQSFGNVISGELLPNFLRKYSKDAFDRVQHMIDDAPYRYSTGIRADIARRQSGCYPTLLSNTADGLQLPAFASTQSATLRLWIEGFWEWVISHCPDPRTCTLLNAPTRKKKTTREKNNASVRETVWRFKRAFGLPIDRSERQTKRMRLTHAMQTTETGSQEWMELAGPKTVAFDDPDAAPELYTFILHEFARACGVHPLCLREALRRPTFEEAFEQVQELAERHAAGPMMHENIACGESVRFFMDIDDVPVSDDQLQEIHKTVRQASEERSNCGKVSRMVVLRNTANPKKRHVVFPALVMTPGNCDIFARILGQSATFQRVFGSGARRVIDSGPYHGFLRMPLCRKPNQNTGGAQDGVYWITDIRESDGTQRTPNSFSPVELLTMACVHPLPGQQRIRLTDVTAVERANKKDASAAASLSKGSPRECTPSARHAVAQGRAICIPRDGPSFGSNAFFARVLNAYYALENTRTDLRQRPINVAWPTDLTAKSVVCKRDDIDTGWTITNRPSTAKYYVRLRPPHNTFTYCCLAQREHTNCSNIWFIITPRTVVQRCHHVKCKKMSLECRNQRSPTVGIVYGV